MILSFVSIMFSCTFFYNSSPYIADANTWNCSLGSIPTFGKTNAPRSIKVVLIWHVNHDTTDVIKAIRERMYIKRKRSLTKRIGHVWYNTEGLLCVDVFSGTNLSTSGMTLAFQKICWGGSSPFLSIPRFCKLIMKNINYTNKNTQQTFKHIYNKINTYKFELIVAEMNWIRRIIGISWIDKIRNEMIQEHKQQNETITETVWKSITLWRDYDTKHGCQLLFNQSPVLSCGMNKKQMMTIHEMHW